MNSDSTINYLEIPVVSIAATKTFFTQAFNWSFQDYGPDYTVAMNAGIHTGFFHAEKHSGFAAVNSSLLVIYAKDIHQAQANVEAAGGNIIKAIFEFPGGCRFHFTDSNNNEFAVWSEKH